MNLQTRKINFVQEFLRLSNVEIVNKLEIILNRERKKKYEQDLKPMSVNEFNEMIGKAETDAKEGKVTEARALKKEIKSWK